MCLEVYTYHIRKSKEAIPFLAPSKANRCYHLPSPTCAGFNKKVVKIYLDTLVTYHCHLPLKGMKCGYGQMDIGFLQIADRVL